MIPLKDEKLIRDFSKTQKNKDTEDRPRSIENISYLLNRKQYKPKNSVWRKIESHVENDLHQKNMRRNFQLWKDRKEMES